MKAVCFGVQDASAIFIYNRILAAPWTSNNKGISLKSKEQINYRHIYEDGNGSLNSRLTFIVGSEGKTSVKFRVLKWLSAFCLDTYAILKSSLPLRYRCIYQLFVQPNMEANAS